MTKDSKAIDLIKQKSPDSKPFVSIEYFPPRTDAGVKVSQVEESIARRPTIVIF